MSFIEAIKTCLTQKYCCFSGRARRSEYWFFMLFTIIVEVVIGLIGYLTKNATVQSILSAIVSLGLLLPSLGVTIRRLHDTNRGWGFIFFEIIPIADIFLLVWMCTAGTTGSNNYGTDPKA